MIVESIPVTGITLDPSSISLFPGQSKLIKAIISPNNATINDKTWSSSNTSVAKVSSNGLVEAIEPGDAIITCTTKDGNHKATCNVTVEEGIRVTGVTLDITEITLKEGESVIIHPTVLPEDASNKSFTLSSSNRDIATAYSG